MAITKGRVVKYTYVENDPVNGNDPGGSKKMKLMPLMQHGILLRESMKKLESQERGLFRFYTRGNQSSCS